MNKLLDITVSFLFFYFNLVYLMDYLKIAIKDILNTYIENFKVNKFIIIS